MQSGAYCTPLAIRAMDYTSALHKRSTSMDLAVWSRRRRGNLRRHGDLHVRREGNAKIEAASFFLGRRLGGALERWPLALNTVALVAGLPEPALGHPAGFTPKRQVNGSPISMSLTGGGFLWQ